MARYTRSCMSNALRNKTPLELLSVVIPAQNEEGCISSTVEHLYLELGRQNVPQEIIVVDDGSTDATWRILESLAFYRGHLACYILIEVRGSEQRPSKTWTH
jgi:glycosyltransferase involved in cell wall biosynthesis